MRTRNKYTEEEKLQCIKDYLESDLSITQFCNINNVNRWTLKSWINWYNQKKEAWQASEVSEDSSIKESTPKFKEDNGKIDDEEFHQYRKVQIEFKHVKISCDKSTFKDIWRVINA